MSMPELVAIIQAERLEEARRAARVRLCREQDRATRSDARGRLGRWVERALHVRRVREAAIAPR